MLTTTMEKNFTSVLKDMKLYHEENDKIDIEKEQNLIEISHKNGNTYSFYIDPIKIVEENVFQVSMINEKGKKKLSIIHSFDDESDIKAGIKKLFM